MCADSINAGLFNGIFRFYSSFNCQLEDLKSNIHSLYNFIHFLLDNCPTPIGIILRDSSSRLNGCLSLIHSSSKLILNSWCQLVLNVGNIHQNVCSYFFDFFPEPEELNDADNLSSTINSSKVENPSYFNVFINVPDIGLITVQITQDISASLLLKKVIQIVESMKGSSPSEKNCCLQWRQTGRILDRKEFLFHEAEVNLLFCSTGGARGGARPGSGAPPGSGGARPGTGGKRPGTGGKRPGTGGKRPGTGGKRPLFN